MVLYLLSQKENTSPYAYEACIVCADDRHEAQTLVPGGKCKFVNGILRDSEGRFMKRSLAPWAIHQNQVKVTFLGMVDPLLEKGIILATLKEA